MRILILSDRIPPENKGGAEAAAWRLAVGLHYAGHEVSVIAATPEKAFEEVREGIPTYHVHSQYPERFRPWLSLYNPQTVGAVAKLYDRIQPDVVNAHNIHYDLSYQTLRIGHHKKIPVVYTAHDVMPFAYTKLTHWINPEKCGVESPEQYRLPKGYNRRQARLRYNPFRNWWIRRVLTKDVQARNTPSHALKEAHEANDLPPYDVVPYGFDVDQFSVSAETIDEMRNRLDLNGRKVILFAGRLTGGKGVAQILQALNMVVEQVPEALLLVLSATSIDKQVQQPEFAHLREKHIRSGGWLTGDELIAAYYVVDVVTVPSIIMDSFPVVNLEAMAAGKPVVATCYGGSPEAVLDGETGYIVNPFNIDDFASKLTRLLTDDALRERMGKSAREHIQVTFPIERQVNEMEILYQRAINTLSE